MYQIATHIQTIRIETDRALQFVDITAEVERAVAESGVSNGVAIIYAKHTTAAIRINEREPLLLQDMAEFLERVAPRNGHYRHNDFSIRTANMTDDECPNGHAHCQHLLMGASEAIPIIAGELQLGRWQRVFLIELDRPRTREVLIQLLGD
ncbi:MAG: secondary thiamine-phosphate synthase enzyme YjbQ [Candidatus Bipolaricaulia bacterium]